jgi:hypothetical protein
MVGTLSNENPSRNFLEKIEERKKEKVRERVVMAASQKWGYIRIISGTILGGVLGFYVMHRVETSYKVSSLQFLNPPFGCRDTLRQEKNNRFVLNFLLLL